MSMTRDQLPDTHRLAGGALGALMVGGVRRSLGVVASVALIVFVALLAGSSASGAGGASIVVYNGQQSQATDNLVAAFEQKTGITVQVRIDDSIILANELLQEGSNSPADVFLSEDSPELMTLEQHGLLAKLPASILDQTASQDNSPDGDWVAVGLHVSVLDYDPALISRGQLPSSILDLAQPRWKGKFGIAPTDPDFAALVGAVIDTYGTKTTIAWLEGLKRNAHTYVDDLTLAYAVFSGSVPCGVINQNYMYDVQLQDGTESELYYFPAGNVGSVTSISGAAVVASSKHKAAAEEFLKFVVSKQGQEIIAHSDVFEYPARPGIRLSGILPPIETLPPLASIPHDTMSPAALGNDALAAQLIEQVGLY
jgi:iron(III) transport system substrate-binding protein